MNISKRIINYFCVVGTGNKLIPQNTEFQKQHTLTSLEIQISQLSEDIPIKDNEKWVDLCGNKQVWLRCIYDQNSQPITSLTIKELKVEDNELKIPLTEDIYPVPIKRKFDQITHQFKGINNGYSLYQGYYDISQYTDQQQKKNYHLVLCYKTQNQNNYQQPICDIQMILADKIDKKKYTSSFSDMRLVIPKDFHALQFPLSNFRFIIFKQKQSPFKVAYMPKIIDRYPLVDHHDSPLSHMISMIPMFCFPQGIYIEKSEIDPISKGQQIFNFVLTSETGKRTYCICLIFHEIIPKDIMEQLGHIDKQQLICYPKSLCLLSSYNYPEQMRELIKYIYRCSLSKNNIPIESTICNIINKIKFPQQIFEQENICLKYVLPSYDICFYTNYKYPVGYNEALECLFRLLDINRIINIYCAILLEKKIHFISNHLSVPGLVIDAFLQLLFPFQFTSILIPVLPDSLRGYIEAPVPFLIGYSQKNIIEQNQHTQVDSLYVYLDTNFIVNCENLTPIPEKALKKLKSSLKSFNNLFNDDYSKQYLKRVDQAYHIYMDDDNYDPEFNKNIDWYQIRNAFLECNSILMKQYKKYIIANSNNEGDFTEIFNVQGYYDHWKKDKFIQQFMETRIFQYFIQERTKFSENESQYQFFDKYMDSKDYKLKFMLPKQIIEIQVPDEDQLTDSIYKYDKFPQLNHDLMKDDQTDDQEINQEILQEEIPQLDQQKWPRYMLETMYKIWFLIFIVNVRNNQDNKIFQQMTEVAILVLEYMREKHLNLTEKLFRYVLESCGYFQMDSKALYLVKLMKEIKLEASPATHGVYFQAVAQAMNQKGLPSDQQQISGVLQEEVILLQRNDGQNSYTNSVYSLHSNCPICKRKLHFEEILDSYRKSQYENTIECLKINQGCGQSFIPKIQITFYQEENPIEAELYDIYNPIQILKNLENIVNIKGDTFLLSDQFEKQYKNLYVNIIFYIRLVKLPYYHLVKIQDTNELQNQVDQSIKKLQMKKSSTIFQRVAQEFDSYRGKVSQQGDSSGNSSSKFKQDDYSTAQNYGSKYMKKLFSSLINDQFSLQNKRQSSSNFQSLQQFDETKAESPK
ncbi:unnamed protein product [Paramecium primaurelia]|uniref:UDENN domain-containing protein n=1 Tax=Paramecium primaurelia TaxID=5886 RepID=A0A8S1Q686_PARPR|nr:unnamed protein product [Paramecium primaurelia]